MPHGQVQHCDPALVRYGPALASPRPHQDLGAASVAVMGGPVQGAPPTGVCQAQVTLVVNLGERYCNITKPRS